MKMLDELYSKLEMISMMSEEEACTYFNADSKAEAIEAIKEDIAYYEGSDDNEEFGVCNTYHLDESFSSWASVNAMFV